MTTAGDAPVRCPHCGRAFVTADRQLLHEGLEHPDRLDENRRTAYEARRREERAALRRYKIRALLVLVLVYFGFLFTYAVVAFG